MDVKNSATSTLTFMFITADKSQLDISPLNLDAPENIY